MTPASTRHRPPRNVAPFAWVAVILLGAAMISCAADPAPEVVVGASIPPLSALVEEVVGDRAAVVALLPTGRSPHDYEPTPAEVARLRGAILFVHVGEEVDGWMGRVATGVMGDDAPVLAMADVSGGEVRDPHLWLDLDVVAEFVPRLVEQLSAADPDGAEGYGLRARALMDSLRVFDGEARDLLIDATHVPFALAHPAFAAFVERYGLNLVGILELHPEGEARPRSLGMVARKLQASGAAVIFVEPQLGRRMAEALAHDAGARLAFLDPLGGTDETYLELLRRNAQQLAENLHDPGD